jgi:TonB-linked SusC/RagA family outer membrane protein
MNLTSKRLLLIAVAFFFAVFQMSAQISLSVKNEEIRSVIQKIEKNGDYRFFYSSDLPGLDKVITMKAENETISEVLDKVFKGTEIKYSVLEGGQISLTSSSQLKKTTSGLVKGKVVDSAGLPLIGVSVSVKNSGSVGSITDIDGNFEFNNVSSNATLVFNYLGFTRKEVQLAGKADVKVVMQESSEVLDDVVVVGYGTMEKRELTSSVSSLKTKDFMAGNTASPIQALAGKITGLSIYSSAGSDPNGSFSLQLRGVNSIKADNEPLIVVDGVPGGSINVLQKEDIVSIDVLKDASAAAIYGTRASGGVILVTTRSGSEGRVSVSYSGEATTESISRRAQTLTADQWRAQGYDDFGANTDWFDAITRTPFTQKHMVSMSGGTKQFNAYASLYYKGAQGMSIGSDREEVGGRLNFTFKTLNDRLELSGRVNYVDIQSNYTSSGIFKDALTLNPTIPIYNEEDPSGYNILTGNDEWNPVAHINLREDVGHNNRLQASFSAKLHILKGLSTTLTVGTNQLVNNYAEWYSALHRESRDENRNGYASQSWNRSGTKSLEWIGNYEARFGKHSLKALAGYSFQETGMKLEFEGNNADFAIDGMKYFDMGEGQYLAQGRAGLSSYQSPRERLISLFGRVNYNYDDRYLLTVSARYEGSSKFGDNNKWGLFPGVSGAWRISSEHFMEDVTWLNDLRLRAGVGLTGNQGFSPGVTTRMYKSDTDPYYVNGKWITIYGLAKNVNYDLQWETKTDWNIGIDFDVLNHRLSGKFDYYVRHIGNLIYDIDVPQPPAVYATTTKNVGGMISNGYEFEISGVPVKTKDWNWVSAIRASHNSTKLLSLLDDDTYYDTYSFPSPGDPGTAVRLAPGQEIGQFFIWKYAGIDENGNWLLYDKDNNVIPAEEKTVDDKRYIGSSVPDLELSWDNTVTWKNFDLNIFFRSWIGHEVFNMTEMYYGLQNVTGKNVIASALTKNAHITGEKELCDYFLEDGTFLKLESLSLGYTLKFKKYIDSLRLSLSGRNLFTLTGYSGLDPEINTTGLTPGFEGLNMYPRTRIYTFGVQLNF